MSDQKLYSLEILRNTFRSSGREICTDSDSVARQHFYLFDYFDRLACVTEVNYRAHFGISPHKTALSEQHITLQSTSGEQDPFAYVGPQPAYPYLFCIFVQLFPGDYTGQGDEAFSIAENPVQDLRGIAGRVVPKGMPFEVYHQFNIGDFCLVLRTDDVQIGYRLANAVRTCTIGRGVVMDTYTIVGIEEPREGQFVKRKVDHCVVLRLSIRNMSALKPLNGLLGKGRGSFKLRGLTGRYDVTITLTLTQFQQMYPFLWKRKFVKPLSDEKSKTTPGNEVYSGNDPVVKWFCDNLSQIEFINERLLVTLPRDSFPTAEAKTLDTEKVDRQNDYVREYFERLRTRKFRFENWIFSSEFKRGMRMLEEVWDNFSDLRYQRDACINGNMFFAQMCLVLRCIEKQLIALEKHPFIFEENGSGEYFRRKHLVEHGFHDLNTWISRAGISMHNFNFRLQAINHQSIQAPIYECQMQMDPGKYLVAYTEFARLFLSEWSGGSEPRQHLLPFFSIDFNKTEPSADPLFLMPYLYKPEKRALVSSNEQEDLLLAINIPNMDSLARIYDMIPLITHELSHNIRISERKPRNELLAKFVFAQISSYVVRHIMARNSRFDRCFCPDSLTDMLCDTLSGLLWEEYEKAFGDILSEQNIGAFISTLQPYLDCTIACFCEDVLDTFIYVKDEEVKTAMTALVALLSPERRKSFSFIPDDGKEWGSKCVLHARGIMAELVRQIDEELKMDMPEGAPGLVLTQKQCELLPNQFEDMLKTCFSKMEKWYRGVSAEQQEKCARWRNRWLDCYMRLKDMHYQYQIIHQYLIYSNGREGRMKQGYKFLDAWFIKCRDRLAGAVPRERALWQAFSPNDHLNRLGLLVSDSKVFVRIVKRTLQTIHRGTLEACIDESVSAYREMFADLGMCAFCNFSAFGYLRFFSRKHKIAFTEKNYMEKSLYYPNADMSSQRILTIAVVLLQINGDAKGERLEKEAISYLHSAKDRLLQEEQAATLVKVIKSWFDDFAKLLSEKNKDYLGAYLPSTLLEFCDTPEKQVFMDKIFPELGELYELVKQVLCIRYLILRKGLRAERLLVEHFKDLYLQMAKKFYKNKDSSGVSQEIGEFYNKESKFYLQEDWIGEEFQSVLRFVQHYYYKNWEVYANTPELQANVERADSAFEANQQRMDQWICKLLTDSRGDKSACH